MPTDIELEPVGKALQEFGRYQSVVYNLPKWFRCWSNPGMRWSGNASRFWV